MTVDLTSEYLGLSLPTPIVASACPLTGDLEMLKRLEAAGIAAAVLPSLFEEQIEFEEVMFGGLMDYGAEAFVEAANYFPQVDTYNTGPDAYLRLVADARQAVSIPIIASLNGVTPGGWTRYAKRIEEAGATALELNMYSLPTDINVTAAELEASYVALVASVRDSISIPLAIKIGPYFSSLPNFASNLVSAGVDGLVLFNRFLQPDFDIERMEVDPRMELSRRTELRLPMRWIAILDAQLDTSLAANSGIHTATDILKLLLVGADVTMLAAALMRHGPEFVTTITDNLRELLEERGYHAVSQLRGSYNHHNTPDPAAFERRNYMKVLTSYMTDMG